MTRESAANVGRTRVEKISRRTSPHQDFHAVTGAKLAQRSSRVWLEVEIGAQATTHGKAGAGNLHSFKVDFVSIPPRQLNWIVAQTSAPAKSVGSVELPSSDQACHVIGRHREALQSARQSTDRNPRGERGDPRYEKLFAAKSDHGDADCSYGCGGQCARRCRVDRTKGRCSENASAEGEREPERR
ncbi:MAG TPA: hypothetical protein VMF66_18615 [Candidatus Acidoferrum sp.]|nr:hypothetical protein [Candidatus Acidoferrum sp.]